MLTADFKTIGLEQSMLDRSDRNRHWFAREMVHSKHKVRLPLHLDSEAISG